MSGVMRGLLVCLLMTLPSVVPTADIAAPGKIEGAMLPGEELRQRALRQREVWRQMGFAAPQARQILFGDLHVHTTFSGDAMLMSLPSVSAREGLHPPADACDFARYCSSLDFWALTDHAEFLSPERWQASKESVRSCNALAGDLDNPDLVSFLGWEWTQVGVSPEQHYGHKNVILRDLEEQQVPQRPIAAINTQSSQFGVEVGRPSLWEALKFPLYDPLHVGRYVGFFKLVREMGELQSCPPEVHVRDLPLSCQERAATPQLLFHKLRQWDVAAMVIPHGTTWGFYTPPGSTWEKQLRGADHDEQLQPLFELWSGHGGSEEYRSWRSVEYDEQGQELCPAATESFLPCCWRAGQIIEERCGDPSSPACRKRVEEARRNYLRAGVAGHLTVSGEEAADWLDCGHCRDCFTPAFQYRPGSSAQYVLALSNFDNPRQPRRFRFGFLASSDVHSARPGTGYKEYGRAYQTDYIGLRPRFRYQRLSPPLGEPAEESIDPRTIKVRNLFLEYFETTRQASYTTTGGLVAVHSASRRREDIWQAMKERHVYGTSGPRILLWFDLHQGEQRLPMGSVVRTREAPRFTVRAVGSLRQKPGCPETSLQGLSAARLEQLCRGECYHPSEERHPLQRIEVVRITPQAYPGEPMEDLIEDPWKVLACPADEQGCVVEFSDADYQSEGRETIYYVRAIQEPTQGVNADATRCDYDEEGNCIKVNLCYGDYRTAVDDDCLSEIEERAWSSPIYLVPSAS